MTVELKADQERIVREKVARGEYTDTAALIQEAVRRLIDEDAVERESRREIIAAVTRADGEIDRGEYLEFEIENVGDLARQVHQRGLTRMPKPPA